jgi:hypothetical protein
MSESQKIDCFASRGFGPPSKVKLARINANGLAKRSRISGVIASNSTGFKLARDFSAKYWLATLTQDPLFLF